MQKSPPVGESSFLNQAEMVSNDNSPSKEVVWVFGDSFTDSMRAFFNGTFRKVVYFVHWAERLEGLPLNLQKSAEKPDMVVIVKVERSF